MLYYLIKISTSALLIVLISELAKRSTSIAAFVTSLPLISIFALTWLYIDTQNISKVAQLSISIFWLVIPSLLFFIALPFFLKNSLSFWLSIVLSIVLTASSYGLTLLILNKLNISL